MGTEYRVSRGLKTGRMGNKGRGNGQSHKNVRTRELPGSSHVDGRATALKSAKNRRPALSEKSRPKGLVPVGPVHGTMTFEWPNGYERVWEEAYQSYLGGRMDLVPSRAYFCLKTSWVLLNLALRQFRKDSTFDPAILGSKARLLGFWMASAGSVWTMEKKSMRRKTAFIDQDVFLTMGQEAVSGDLPGSPGYILKLGIAILRDRDREFCQR
jgi:hypothetical protein